MTKQTLYCHCSNGFRTFACRRTDYFVGNSCIQHLVAPTHGAVDTVNSACQLRLGGQCTSPLGCFRKRCSSNFFLQLGQHISFFHQDLVEGEIDASCQMTFRAACPQCFCRFRVLCPCTLGINRCAHNSHVSPYNVHVAEQ